MSLSILPISGGLCPRLAAAVLGLILSISLARAQDNTATGSGALLSVTTGADDTADGFDALGDTTSGGDNTAVGMNSLLGNRLGARNTAVGSSSLHNSDASDNTALGYNALYFTVTGAQNTAVGSNALTQNHLGSDNTATGFDALTANTVSNNTATGAYALSANLTGTDNTANGYQALDQNTTGNSNTAEGAFALAGNRTGNDNTAFGEGALLSATSGSLNTAIGAMTLSNPNFAGSSDTAIGYNAGSAATLATNSIYINSPGSAADGSVIDIGTQGVQTATTIAGIYGETSSGGVAVYINSSGQLGTLASSARFKADIRDIGDQSEELFSLRPVTFHYKPEIDPKSIAQFGLVAEEVEKVDPALVVHDANGQPYSVRYEQVNAMLLNEFLKQHKQVDAQRAEIAALEAADAAKRREIAAAEARYQSELQAAEARHRDEIAALRIVLQERATLIRQVMAEVASDGRSPELAVHQATNGEQWQPQEK